MRRSEILPHVPADPSFFQHPLQCVFFILSPSKTCSEQKANELQEPLITVGFTKAFQFLTQTLINWFQSLETREEASRSHIKYQICIMLSMPWSIYKEIILDGYPVFPIICIAPTIYLSHTLRLTHLKVVGLTEIGSFFTGNKKKARKIAQCPEDTVTNVSGTKILAGE